MDCCDSMTSRWIIEAKRAYKTSRPHVVGSSYFTGVEWNSARQRSMATQMDGITWQTDVITCRSSTFAGTAK
jgi:hypothetical protein